VAFTEALKINVRKQAHFSCCLCHAVDVEVHHIIPQGEGGPDSEDNAAPLCASCHNIYGANPQKRKFIREARDHWYEVCRKRFATDPDGLEEIRQLLRRLTESAQIRDSSNESNRRYPNQPAEGESPSGALHFELRGDPHELGAEIWLWGKDRQAAMKLCDTEGWGNLRLYFSPDDRHALVRDGGSSMGIHFRLFSRDAPDARLNFREVETAAIEDKAELFALQQAGQPAQLVLHHRYVGFLDWSEDSTAILFRMTGRGNFDGKACHIDWIGIYDLLSHEVTTNLQCMNRKAVDVYDHTQNRASNSSAETD